MPITMHCDARHADVSRHIAQTNTIARVNTCRNVRRSRVPPVFRDSARCDSARCDFELRDFAP